MKRKHKVCHLSSVHQALDTRLYYRFCKSLSWYYDVTLIAVHPHAETREGIKIIPFRRFKNKLLRVTVTWLIMFFKAIWVNARIYQIHDPELIPCGILLRLCGKKVILDIHENVAEDIFDKPWIHQKKLLYTLFSFFEKRAVRLFHIFLAENSYEPRYKALGAHYTVVLNYHDPAFFEPFIKKNRSDGNRLFYIGILLRSRGILEILKAIYLLKEKNTIVYFDVVGELYSDLAAEIEALPFIEEIRDQVVFHGRMNLDEGYEISKSAALGMCVIHPMRNSTGSYPTKMFEYMAIGLPQITSDFELYRSVVEVHRCGICVDPTDPFEIAEVVESLLKNKVIRMEMANSGIEASKNYTWDTQFDKALKVYRNLLHD